MQLLIRYVLWQLESWKTWSSVWPLVYCIEPLYLFSGPMKTTRKVNPAYTARVTPLRHIIIIIG